jgi:hypothetical protein
MKSRFKNQRFETMESLKKWLHNMMNEIEKETIKLITETTII